jgi:acyl-CoA synthetase (AMP-forming)/AMP-acid ligase II
MQGRIAKWWLPDEVVLIEAIPHTATGKSRRRPFATCSGITASGAEPSPND